MKNSGLFENLVALDRIELERILAQDFGLQELIELEEISCVFYAMVSRGESTSGENSKVNFSYPLEIWNQIKQMTGVSFVWISSIFTNDNVMVAKHPYLVEQNKAHRVIVESLNNFGPLYSRILFSQIYGSPEFLRHQPFLYNLDSSIRRGLRVQLLNGGSTFRNFLHVEDVSRVLVDYERWLGNPDVALLAKMNFAWLEIAEFFKQHYSSVSEIQDEVSLTKLDQRSYNLAGLTDLSDSYDLMEIDSVILSGDFR